MPTPGFHFVNSSYDGPPTRPSRVERRPACRESIHSTGLATPADLPTPTALSHRAACSSLLPPPIGSSSRNYYDVLQVSKGATEEQIKRAYRKLALKYHPVRRGGGRGAGGASAHE